MKKVAAKIPLGALRKVPWAGLARTGAGATAGGLAGYYATPQLGYADSPEAKRISAITDAALGALVGGAAHRAGGYRKGVQAFKKLPLMRQAALPGSVAAGELLPVTHALQQKKMEQVRQQGGLINQLQDTAGQLSIPAALQRAFRSPVARGMGAGAGVAGLAALLTGLLRRKSEKEQVKHRGRAGMVGSDFLKYLLPALVAGGVAGSFSKKPKV